MGLPFPASSKSPHLRGSHLDLSALFLPSKKSAQNISVQEVSMSTHECSPNLQDGPKNDCYRWSCCIKFTYSPYKYRKIHVFHCRGGVAPPQRVEL